MAKDVILVPADQIVGLAEVAESIGERRNTVSNWINRGSTNGFPAPVARIAAGPIWDMRDVQEWCLRRGQSQPNK